MYNALFATNNDSDELLSMLDLTKDEFKRYRDCYLSKDGKSIIVYTRLGGGNRPDYQEVYKQIKKHPYYIKDYDDDFDSTYASFEFIIPEKHKERVAEIFKTTDTTTGAEKFQELFTAMDKDMDKALNDNPRVKRFTENLIKQFEDPNAKKIKDGVNTIFINNYCP